MIHDYLERKIYSNIYLIISLNKCESNRRRDDYL